MHKHDIVHIERAAAMNLVEFPIYFGRKPLTINWNDPALPKARIPPPTKSPEPLPRLLSPPPPPFSPVYEPPTSTDIPMDSPDSIPDLVSDSDSSLDFSFDTSSFTSNFLGDHEDSNKEKQDVSDVPMVVPSPIRPPTPIPFFNFTNKHLATAIASSPLAIRNSTPTPSFALPKNGARSSFLPAISSERRNAIFGYSTFQLAPTVRNACPNPTF